MKKRAIFLDCESKANQLKESSKEAASVSLAPKAPVETVSMFNINSLPDLPFGAFFELIPLVDLLSAQFVCQQWQEASVREASTHRDSITLRIDGEAEDQKTTRYLERSVWNLPHAEVLKTDDGTPLYPDYVPPSKRSTWNNLLLGTRLDNPIQRMDGTLPTAEEHQQWQINYDQSFQASLDQKVSQLLALFPRGPRTLTIVCRSEHRDFLQLLPLLTSWKENLVTLKLFSSHPLAFQTEEATSYSRSSYINHTSNRPLLAALNSMSSLRHLTLDLLGEEGDNLYDWILKNQLTQRLEESGVLDSHPDFTFFRRLESFTFADRNLGETLYSWIHNSTLSSPQPPSSLPVLQIGNHVSSLNRNFARKYLRPFSKLMSHLHVHPRWSDDNSGAIPLDVSQDPSPFASLSSLYLNLLHTPYWRVPLSFFLKYLTLNVELIHLRLHLTGEHVTRWFREMKSLREDQRSSLPRLRVLSLILVENRQMDHRLSSIFHRLFPSLQVIVIQQRLIKRQLDLETISQCVRVHLRMIGYSFSKSLFPQASSLLLLEGRCFFYKRPNFKTDLSAPDPLKDFGTHLNLLQSQERIWSVGQLRSLIKSSDPWHCQVGSDH